MYEIQNETMGAGRKRGAAEDGEVSGKEKAKRGEERR